MSITAPSPADVANQQLMDLLVGFHKQGLTFALHGVILDGDNFIAAGMVTGNREKVFMGIVSNMVRQLEDQQQVQWLLPAIMAALYNTQYRELLDQDKVDKWQKILDDNAARKPS